jgi:hypothetical protein
MQETCDLPLALELKFRGSPEEKATAPDGEDRTNPVAGPAQPSVPCPQELETIELSNVWFIGWRL